MYATTLPISLSVPRQASRQPSVRYYAAHFTERTLPGRTGSAAYSITLLIYRAYPTRPNRQRSVLYHAADLPSVPYQATQVAERTPLSLGI